jgi:hypothetical protein
MIWLRALKLLEWTFLFNAYVAIEWVTPRGVAWTIACVSFAASVVADMCHNVFSPLYSPRPGQAAADVGRSCRAISQAEPSSAGSAADPPRHVSDEHPS